MENYIYEKPRYLNAGDQYLNIEFGDIISIKLNLKMINLTHSIKEAKIKGVFDVHPTWRSILIHFDNLKISKEDLIKKIDSSIIKNAPVSNQISTRIIEIPTRFGGKWGKDLSFVAEHNNVTEEEAIKIHTEQLHWCGIIGFVPGHPFLRPTGDRYLSVPYYKTPRTYTPRGTFGLGGISTTNYTVPAPGGYQMIGITPVPLYDPHQIHLDFQKDPILLKHGDLIKFKPINDDEMDDLRQQVYEQNFKFNIQNNYNFKVD